MNTIKRSRADSKKNTQIKAADVKAHHAKKKRIESLENNTQSGNSPLSSIPNTNPDPIPDINSNRASIHCPDVGNLPPLKPKFFIRYQKIKSIYLFELGSIIILIWYLNSPKKSTVISATGKSVDERHHFAKSHVVHHPLNLKYFLLII